MKILVISSNLIGDTILSTCVIKHFLSLYPNSKFTFIVGPTSGQIYKNFLQKDKIFIIKKKKFNLHWLDIYKCCISNRWDIIIDLRSSLISYFVPSKKSYIFKKNNNLNHLEQLKKSFNFVNSSLFIETSKEEEEEVVNQLDDNFKYVAIFPGGNWDPKIWPVEYFNKLIQILNYKYNNLQFILVGSLEEKNVYLNKIKQNLPQNIFLDLFGKSLTLTSAYLKKTNLFIGNDSGLMHLSVASNCVTIGLFGPTNDKIYGHKNTNSYVIRTKENYEFFSKSLIDDTKSYMTSLEPKEIINLIEKEKLL